MKKIENFEKMGKKAEKINYFEYFLLFLLMAIAAELAYRAEPFLWIAKPIVIIGIIGWVIQRIYFHIRDFIKRE